MRTVALRLDEDVELLAGDGFEDRLASADPGHQEAVSAVVVDRMLKPRNSRSVPSK